MQSSRPNLGRNSVIFVVKTTKYCNLRCTYCYEFNELDDKRRISTDNVERLFENIKPWAVLQNFEKLKFSWHGGEPLLLPLDYYDSIYDRQRRVFGASVSLWNAVQTNLTVLTDRHVEYLKSGPLFDSIGISFDVFGGQRRDIKGKERTEVILRNMQKLIDNEIPFGAISVLSRNTLGRERDIYRFYDSLGIHSRVLPFYLLSHAEQAEPHGLTGDEITEALKVLFAAWLSSEHATPVQPIEEYLEFAIAILLNTPRRYYNRGQDESVFIVNTDGGIYNEAEAYDPEYCYGNIFKETFESVLASPIREMAIVASEARQTRYCNDCPHFGHCDGSYVADAAAFEQRALAETGCRIRGFLDHMVDVLSQSLLFDEIVASRAMRATEPALEIAL
jgi:uncharacterized protein